MRFLISLLLLVSTFAHAAPPIVWGSGDSAKVLQDAISFKTESNATIKAGTADPSQTATAGNQGSIYLSTNGSVYLKGDSGTTSNWAPVNSRWTAVYDTHFIGGSTAGLTAATGGTASACQVDDAGVTSTRKAIGEYKCQVGTTTTGRGHLGSSAGSVNTIRFGDQAIDYGWWAWMQALSDGTDTFHAMIGFFDSLTSATPNNSTMFRYTHGTNSGKWECVTRDNGGTENAVDTGVAGNIVYNEYRILVPAAGTPVTFMINGAIVCGGPISTGVPTNARKMGHGAQMIKSAGTNNRNFNFDRAWFYVSGARPQ